MRKILLYVLAALVVVAIGVAVFMKISGRGISLTGGTSTIKNLPTVNVSGLSDSEKDKGTILYPGATPISDGSKIYKVPDSVDAVINTYAIDLGNRYKAQVTKKETKRAESLTGKATTVSISSGETAISVVIWAGKDGFSYFEVGK